MAKKHNSRKSLAIALGIVGIAGLSMASAAQLTVASSTVAAGTVAVSGCDAAVSVNYTTAWATGGYQVTSINVTGIDATACAGLTVRATLTDTAGASLGGGSAAVAASVAIPVTISAAAVEGVAVAIG